MSEGITEFPDLGENIRLEDLERNLEELHEKLKNEIDGGSLENTPLAKNLAQNKLMRSDSNRIRLLTACCMADVFRLRAPECPYEDKDRLKKILDFFIEQFQCFEKDDDFCLEKSSYLIASLAKAKTLKLYLDFESSSYFVAKVFTHLLAIVRRSQSLKEIGGIVRRFMVDILASLLNEPDSISDELIESMKEFLIGRDDSPIASQLCREVISKAPDGLESHMDRFFKTELEQGDIGTTHDLFMELYKIIPHNLTCFVLQLASKLESEHDSIRLATTELVAKLLANEDLISAFPGLHKSFLARYDDKKYQIRMKCVELSLPLILSQSTLRDEILEAMEKRQHDGNESVRFQVVFTILKVAEKDITVVSELGLLDIVKGRTLDTNFKVRRLALLGIGQLYRKFTSKPPPPPVGDDGNEQHHDWQEDSEAAKKVDWIPNKVLHRYYQMGLQDRLIVERILYTCLVPFWLPSEERTQKLYQLFTTSDDNAIKALIKILTFQRSYREQLRVMMHLSDECTARGEARGKELDTLARFMAEQVSDDIGTKEHILEFLELVRESPTLYRHAANVLEAKTFEEVNENVRGIMKTLGNPNSALFATVKRLLERIAPLVVDSSGVSQILESARENLECVKEEEGRRCLELLSVLSDVHPGTFVAREILEKLSDLLATKWEPESSLLLVQILYNLRKKNIEQDFPDCAESLRKVLLKLLENGSPKQAKLAVRCIDCIFGDAVSCFSEALLSLKRLLLKSTPHLETILVSLGQIAGLRPESFFPHRDDIVIEIAVKKILMAPEKTAKSKSRSSKSSNDQVLPAATRRKLAAMKLITNASIGLANLYCLKAPRANEERKTLMRRLMNWNAECTLRLLFIAVDNDGDLMKSGNLSEDEKSQFRLKAATSILKICRFKNYADIVTGTQFRTLTKIITDPSQFVRERFCEKLHKRLLALKLPLYFMALFSYGALEPDIEHQEKMKGYLLENIKKRREHLKYGEVEPAARMALLPDNVIGYVIHMLAHDPSLIATDDVRALERIRECLWFQLQFHCCDSNENYSFPSVRRLVESIKRSRDRENPLDAETNKRLYAVCDLTLGLIMSRTTNFKHTTPPEKVLLPSALFVRPSQNAVHNSKYYLPAELTFTPPAPRNRTPSRKVKRTPAEGSSTPRQKRKAPRVEWSDEEDSENEGVEPDENESNI